MGSEADVDALSFSYDDFQSAVTNTEYSFERDAIVKGCAIEYQPKGAFVDIGAKASAYLPEAEAALIQPSGCVIDDLVALNEEFDCQIISEEDENGQILQLKFLEVNQENNKLVVSNRKAVVETQMANLSRGDLVEGSVQALKPYGAFIEVGGMSGLLHISQISYDRIEDLEKVLQPGMAVKCMIIDHDKVNGRIALSTKTLEPNPGDMLRDSQKVFDMAEDSAEKYHTKMEEERKARESAARDIVLGLGDSLDGLGDFDLDGSGDSSGSSSDPLADVSDSLDSLLS